MTNEQLQEQLEEIRIDLTDKLSIALADAALKDLSVLVIEAVTAAAALGKVSVTMALTEQLGRPERFPAERAEAMYETAWALLVLPLPNVLETMTMDSAPRLGGSLRDVLEEALELAHARYRINYRARIRRTLGRAT